MKNQIETFFKLGRDENMMFSPLSLNMVLSVLSEAATGDTQDKIRKYLRRDYTNLIPDFSRNRVEDENNKLLIANGAWIDQKYEISKRMQDAMKDYQTDIFREDLSNTAHLSQEVNGYIKERTFGMIPEMVQPRDLEGCDSVLANTVFFQSSWKKHLNRYSNVFTEKDGIQKKVDFVVGTADVYMETDSAIAFSKYYTNNLEFVGILPQGELEDVDIEELLQSRKNNPVSMEMPVLNFETKMDLTSIFPALGLEDFLTGRNMTGFYADETAFHISKLLQNTKIELDENGTKASAATMASLVRGLSFNPYEHKVVILNRPFLFVIYDRFVNEIVFIGKVLTV